MFSVIPGALSRLSRGRIPRRTEKSRDKLIIVIVQTGQSACFMCVDFMQEYVDIFVWQDMLSIESGR